MLYCRNFPCSGRRRCCNGFEIANWKRQFRFDRNHGCQCSCVAFEILVYESNQLTWFSQTTLTIFIDRLRDLADPIIPTELYDYCVRNSEDTAMTLAVLERIPEENRNVLNALIHFLQIVGDPANQPVTRMSINNIAMVFAPNILR